MDLFKYEPRLLQEGLNPYAPTTFTEKETNDIVGAIPTLETQYDDFALGSYEKFKKLRDQDVIGRGVRFLVCLPTPLNVVSVMIRSAFLAKVEPLYEDAMMRSLTRILDSIPPSDLTIQYVYEWIQTFS